MPRFGSDKPTPAWLMILVALLGTGGTAGVTGYFATRNQSSVEAEIALRNAILQDKVELRADVAAKSKELGDKNDEIRRLQQALAEQRDTQGKLVDQLRDKDNEWFRRMRDLQEENQRLRMELLKANLPLTLPATPPQPTNLNGLPLSFKWT